MELCAGSFAQNRIIKRSITHTARGNEYPGSVFQGGFLMGDTVALMAEEGCSVLSDQNTGLLPQLSLHFITFVGLICLFVTRQR